MFRTERPRQCRRDECGQARLDARWGSSSEIEEVTVLYIERFRDRDDRRTIATSSHRNQNQFKTILGTSIAVPDQNCCFSLFLRTRELKRAHRSRRRRDGDVHVVLVVRARVAMKNPVWRLSTAGAAHGPSAGRARRRSKGHTHGPALRLLGRRPARLGRVVARVVGRLRGAPDATRAHVAPWRQRRGAVARLRGGNRPGGTDRAPRRVVSEPPPRGNGRHGPHPKALPRRLAQGRRPIAP